MNDASAQRTTRAAAGALLTAVALGCGGGPEPLPSDDEPASRPVREEPPGVLAPVDRWKRELAARLPAPWEVARVDARVTAPRGWTRFRGDRGLVIALTDGAEEQRYWVMPDGWRGEAVDADASARELTRNDEFFLFGPPEDAPGWDATEEVRAALGF